MNEFKLYEDHDEFAADVRRYNRWVLLWIAGSIVFWACLVAAFVATALT